MMEYIIGIDPGLKGGIAFYNPNGLVVFATPTFEVDFIKKVKGKSKKSKRNEMDLIGAARLILDISSEHRIQCAYLEHVTAGKGQGVTGMFRFGQNFGQWQGLLAGLNIRTELVRPQIWKQSCNLIGTDKNASRELAKERYPNHVDNFRLVKQDGLAEATLIGQYGWEKEHDSTDETGPVNVE